MKSTDFTQTLSMPSFNASLGTLKDVVISYTDEVNIVGTVLNTSATAQTFTVSETVNFGLSYGGSSLLTNSLTGQQKFTSLAVGATGNYGIIDQTGGAGPVTVMTGPILAAFTNPKTPVTFDFGTLTKTIVSGGGGNITTGIYTKAIATLSVRYDYSVNPAVQGVPEPASLLMMAMSGIILTSAEVARRSRRRGQAAR